MRLRICDLAGRCKWCGGRESNPLTCSLVEQTTASAAATISHMDGCRQTPHRSTLHTIMPAISFLIVTIFTSLLAFTEREVWQPKEMDALASTLAFVPTTGAPTGQWKDMTACNGSASPLLTRRVGRPLLAQKAKPSWTAKPRLRQPRKSGVFEHRKRGGFLNTLEQPLLTGSEPKVGPQRNAG